MSDFLTSGRKSYRELKNISIQICSQTHKFTRCDKGLGKQKNRKMKQKIHYIALIIISSIVLSCKQDFTEGISPSQRNANNIKELRDKLTQAEYGWRMTYFSKTDSLLFSNKKQILQKIGGRYRDLYGYGGHYFTLKFDKKGTVKILADYTQKTITETKESEFEIKQNTFTELSFTTYNYIHQLVNEEFQGSSDFLYVGKDFKGDLIFKTSSNIEPAREYMVLQKLKSEKSWEDDVKKSYENRKFFDNMENPQITIRKGDRFYFKSDVVIKTDSQVESYKRFLKDMVRKRYYVFEYDTYGRPCYTSNCIRTVGLGSGYVGTEKGLSFYPGIRYDKNYIFYDFERQGDKFVCELVRIYDSLRGFMYVSKHLFPDGEPTFMVAEIKDEKK